MIFTLSAIDWGWVFTEWKQFSLIVAGMALYCLFVFSFYKRASKPHLFTFSDKDCKNSKYPTFMRFWCRFAYVLKYVFVGPIVLMCWAALLSALVLLMQDNSSVAVALLISMALLATIRITSYIHEDLSIDIAKIMPLALLAFFLIDLDQINLPEFWQKVLSIPTIIDSILMYFLFIVLLELFLRLLHAILAANKE